MTTPSLGEAARLWLKVAALSFGGPAAQISVMHRLVVHERRWVEEQQFLHALNFCMILPGPEAMQLATYLGWRLNGIPGGLIAGLLFIAPGIAVIWTLSVLYWVWGESHWLAGALFGMKAAVLAIVAQAAIKLAGKALRTFLRRAIALAAFVALFAFHIPFPLIILSAGLVGWLIGAPPAMDNDPLPLLPSWRRTAATALFWALLWLAPIAGIVALFGPDAIYSQIALFFAKLAVLTFGGAYAILAWVAQQAVDHYHWLTSTEMLDGLGLAETTPGPLIMVLQFVGFMAAANQAGIPHPLLAGSFAGLIATWATFAPCFLWIFTGAPYVEHLRRLARLSNAMAAVSSAVVGVIANLAIWFAIHTLFHVTQKIGGIELPLLGSVDWPAVILATSSAIGLMALRLGMFTTLGFGVACGLLLAL